MMTDEIIICDFALILFYNHRGQHLYKIRITAVDLAGAILRKASFYK